MTRAWLSRAAGRLRPLALNAGLVLFSLVLTLLLAELVIRWVAPQQLILIRPDLWQPADTVGWLRRPDVAVEINTGERTVTVRTDAGGFRVGEAGRVPADLNVLLLGDSFMEALQVEHEQSLAGLLEARLAAELGEPVSVWNAGVGGWDPDQYALHARSLLAARDFDVVLTSIYLGNDVITQRRDYLPPRTPVERYRFRFPRALSADELVDAFLRPVNDMLEVRSHLFLFFKNRLQTLRMALGLAPLTFPPQYLKSEADSERWDVTAELAEDIRDMAVADGADALFVLIPATFQIDSLSLQRYVAGYGLDPSTIDLDQPNRRLGADLAARGMRVYDPLDRFRAAHEAGHRLYGAVDQHFSPEGHRLLADLIGPEVAGVLRARRSSAERSDR